MDYSPERFREDFILFLNENGFPTLHSWQKDIIEHMTESYAICTQQNTLEVCKQTPAVPKYGNSICQKEEVNPMASYASATVVAAESIEAGQRYAVRSALSTAFEKAKLGLKKQFGLIDDDAPKTPTELVERIAAGKYTIDAKDADYEGWDASSAVRYVRWRDPAVVEDKAGYKAARADLDAAYEDAKLKAILSPVADLLQLVEDFKAWKHA